MSLNINAATSSGSFYGTDFNPSQAAYASQVSRASGKSLSIFDDSFEEFARRDLPQFDIIALHGIWSWVSGEARDAIIEIARAKLKPGGILYISYNCKPGWAPIEPLRHLLNLHVSKAATGGLLARVEESLHFVRYIVEPNAGYFAQYPAIGNMVEAIGKLDRNNVSMSISTATGCPNPSPRFRSASMRSGWPANGSSVSKPRSRSSCRDGRSSRWCIIFRRCAVSISS